MLDKFVIAKSAQKFIAKGQIGKAIAEWEGLLKEKQDGNIYNIVGDLYLRKKAKREAIEAFTQAAKIFREDGFYLKAIALYKKILNIAPSEVNTLISLAELNAGKGLIGNAIENFLAAAEIYIREGSSEKALDLYEKILKLTPSNINLKIKIAELYLKIGLRNEAIKEYLAIASGYLENGENEKAREFYLKVIDFNPQDITALIGLSKIAEKTADIKQAYEYLNQAISFAPQSSDVLFNYARLSIETNNIDGAKQTLTRLIEIDSSNNQYKKLLGNIYLKEGSLEKALEELLPSIDEVLLAQRWDEALELLNKFKGLEHMAVRHRLATLYKGKGDKKAAINELSALAKIYESRGLLQDALKSYKELIELTPFDGAVQDKIEELEKILGVFEEKPVEEMPSEVEVVSVEGIAPSESFEEKLAEADFYALQGLKDEAIKLYEELLSISPDNENVIKKLELLRPAEKHGKRPLQPAEETIAHIPVDNELRDIFHELKKGVKEEQGEQDYETHYNLGIAYREMGLLEDAVREFQITAKDPKRTLQSLNMLALCYMDKKHYPLAVKEFKNVVESMAPTDYGYLGAKCDLADAYVKNKEYNNALKLYMEIHAHNPAFRDVANKVKIIKSLVSEAKDKPKSKKDRVSYI